MRLDWRGFDGAKFGDTISQGLMDREAADIVAKYQPYQQYSPEQAEQMKAAAEAINPETGKPYYDVTANEDGTYTYATQGADGAQGHTGLMSPQYRVGDTYQAEKPTDKQVRGLAHEELRNYWLSKGSLGEERIKALDTQRSADAQEKLVGLQTKSAEMQLSEKEKAAAAKSAFDADYAAIQEQQFNTPEARTAATLDAYGKHFGPEKRLEMEKDYGAVRLNQITTRAAELKQAKDEALQKGLDGLAAWYDDVNDGFTVATERSNNGIAVYRVGGDGKRELVAQGKNEADALTRLNAMLTPGGMLELAKVEADIERSKAATRASNAEVTKVSEGLSRDKARVKLAEAIQAETDPAKRQGLVQQLQLLGNTDMQYKTTTNANGESVVVAVNPLDHILGRGQGAAPALQPVTYEGKVIGQAATPEEARALLEQYRAGNAAPAPAAGLAKKSPVQVMREAEQLRSVIESSRSAQEEMNARQALERLKRDNPYANI